MPRPGMPLNYPHWSFGKRFAQQEMLYRKGFQQLALEIVINSDPSLCYIMEDNTMAAQATVIAHAAIGHNHFFRHNEVFRAWTEADTVLDELRHARNFVMDCEERHGRRRSKRCSMPRMRCSRTGWTATATPSIPTRPRPAPGWPIAAARRATRPTSCGCAPCRTARGHGRRCRGRRAPRLGLPEENILMFLEHHAPLLAEWQRELLRIVRWFSTYFEPQRQTKLMNEGCATWTHFEIMTRLRDKGLIADGAYLEFLDLHSMVVAQPTVRSSGLFRAEPLCARLRDDARHRADLHRTDRGRPCVVSRHRRQ